MPDSIREVLQGIAEVEPPSRDLAAGAYRRARSIARRRVATIAFAVVAGLAMAGGTTAAIVDRDRAEELPPAVDPTVGATDPTTVPDDDPTAEDEATPTGAEAPCGLEWSGWAPSGSMTDLGTLPDGLVFEVRQDGASAEPTFVRFEGGEPQTVLQNDGEYFMAPDGSRFLVGSPDGCTGTVATLTGDKVDGVGVFTAQCKPSWSPDSDRVVLNEADASSTGGYLLDLSTGEAAAVPEEVGCSPRWSGDGEFLVSSDGSVAMRPDGGDRVELAGAEVWNADEEFTGVSSVSADLSRACLQYDDAETAQAGHTQAHRCDRYVDTATGEVLDLPVEAQNPNVVFLADGSMIVCDDQYGQIVVTLADSDGKTMNAVQLPGQSSGGTILRGYYTG
ncbi:hypothetical protein [Glycomyces sp. NPDC048151]|uniref:hypothetical protein n=1 Tax=Glycomyces sp. NPDC048151 TaxID=3364002 RepID=UPI00371F8361